jgi:MFS family permease
MGMVGAPDGPVTMPREPETWSDFNAFHASAFLAVISGTLAFVAPFFLGLTGALGALAFAAWVADHFSGPRSRPPNRGAYTSVSVFALGVTGFLLLPQPVESARGFVLGASLLPLWWSDRAGTGRSATTGGDP